MAQAAKKAAAPKAAATKDSGLTDMDALYDAEAQQSRAEGFRLEFPSVADDVPNGVELEVAKRSQDVHADHASKHRKTFVVLKSQWNESVDQEREHQANLHATRQYLMGQGLRPTGDGGFAGSDDHPDGVSLLLHYDVPVVPAIVAGDTEPEEAAARFDAFVPVDQ